MRKPVAFLLALIGAVAPALAVGLWTLTTADFEKSQVTLSELRGETLVVRPVGGEATVEVPLDRFLELQRNDPPAAEKRGLALHLVGGGVLVGTPVRVEGDTVIWSTASVGDLPASLRRAVGISRAGQPLPRSGDASNQDRVQLLNGDIIEGILADASAEELTLQIVGGDPIPVPLDSVASVVFAAGAREEPSRTPGFQVCLADGSTVRAQRLSLADGQLEFAIADESRRVPLDAVWSIEQVNGPVTWLSDLPPVENVQRPFMGEPVPAHFNETLAGHPIQIAGQSFGKGIAVHSYSRLVYDVSEGFRTFRTRYAIEGPADKADVTVRILVDGKLAHEQANVTAGAISPVHTIDLAGAKQLTLEVDYGQTYDVQDRLIWLEPALLR